VIRQVRSRRSSARRSVLAYFKDSFSRNQRRFEVENLPDLLLDLGAVGRLDIDALKSATNKAASRTRAFGNLHGRSWLIKTENLF
jgi:hypothetical protein